MKGWRKMTHLRGYGSDTILVSVRCDRVHANRKYSIRRSGRRVHDPSQCSSHHDHTHLPSLAVLQTHHSACWCGAEGKRSCSSLTASAWRRSLNPLLFSCQIMLCHDARNTAWVSLDGRKRQEISHGDRLVTLTSHPSWTCGNWCPISSHV